MTLEDEINEVKKQLKDITQAIQAKEVKMKNEDIGSDEYKRLASDKKALIDIEKALLDQKNLLLQLELQKAALSTSRAWRTDTTKLFVTNLTQKINEDRQKMVGGNKFSISENFLTHVLVNDWPRAFGGLKMPPLSDIMTFKLGSYSNSGIVFDFFDLNNTHEENMFQYFFLRVVKESYDFDTTMSENDCIAIYNSVICSPLKEINSPDFGIIDKFAIHRSSSLVAATRTSSTSEKTNGRHLLDKALERPDFWMADTWGRILFKGEEKASSDDLQEARDQLQSYCFGHSKQQYAGIRYTFGYVAAGAQVELYAFDHECDNSESPKRINITTYQLSQVQDRVRLVVNVICLYHICMQISAANRPERVCSETIINPSTGCRVELFQNGYVLKTVKENQVYASQTTNKMKDLLAFYELINVNNHQIKYTAKCIHADIRKRNKEHCLVVLMTPVCKRNALEKARNNLDQLKYMLHCVLRALESMHQHGYTHNDVRWPNIVLFEPKPANISDKNSIDEVSSSTSSAASASPHNPSTALQSQYLVIDYENLLKISPKKNGRTKSSERYGSVETDIESVFELFKREGFFTESEEVSCFVKQFKKLKTSRANLAEMIEFVDRYQPGDKTADADVTYT